MSEPTTPTHKPGDAEQYKNQLLALVLERAYTRSETPFVLSSGGTSHDYVDMRRGVSGGDALRLAAEALLALVASHGTAFDAIGGMTMGADPVAHAVALVSGKSWFSVRKAEKSHGARQRIEGKPLDASVKVLLFEDTVSTGRSVLEAADVIVETGAEIVAAATLLDRGDAAAPLLAGRGIDYWAVLTYRDLGIDSITGPTPT